MDELPESVDEEVIVLIVDELPESVDEELIVLVMDEELLDLELPLE